MTSNPAIIDRDRLRSGGESEAAADTELDEYLHLYMVNRGVLMTPFHNMALMSPATTEQDVDLHTRLFAEAITELTAGEQVPSVK